MIEEIKLTGPSVNRHRSVQVVATPWAFIHAVEAKFGRINPNHELQRWQWKAKSSGSVAVGALHRNG